jgi:transcriptional regulator with XRE-family HTH domain
LPDLSVTCHIVNPARSVDTARRRDPGRPNGATIRAIRQARQMRLDELAARADITASYLSRIEHGTRAGTAQAELIAAALDVPAAILTGQLSAIETLREAAGIDRDGLAHTAGITPAQLARIEQGAELPDENLIRVIANRLGVDPAALRPHIALGVAS